MQLILVTINYPFGNGEQFIDNELLALRESFEHITIFPLIAKGESRLKALPENISVNTIISDQLRSPKHIIAGFFHGLKIFRHCWKEPFSSRKPIRHLQLILKYTYSSGIIARFFAARLTSQIPVIYYSYWLNQGATAISLLSSEKKINNVGFISRAHSSDLFPEGSPSGKNPTQLFQLKNLDAVFAISEKGRNSLQKQTLNLTSACRLVTSRLGVKKASSINHPSPDGSFHFVSCSYIIPRKRVDLIFEVVKRMAENHPEISFNWTHIGSGPGFEAISDLSKNSPENLKVNLTGQLNQDQIYEIYSSEPIDLFINLSTLEGVPVSIMEAFSFGIPVIATAAGGTPEIVKDDAGIVVPVESNANEIAEKIQNFISSLAFNGARKSAYKIWEDEYSADNNYAGFLDEMMSTLNR